MSRLTSEKNVKVAFAPAIADIAAPTAAEMAASTDITSQLPTTGLGVEWTENNASIAMLDEGFNPEQVGTRSARIVLTLVRDDTADPAYDLFTYGLEGFLVIGRFGSNDTATDKVEVYPIETHDPVPLPPAENEFQQFRVTCAVSGAPNVRAVVAA